jgi:hypothetical protein
MAIYRNPQARAQILGVGPILGEQTPEKTEIASRILEKGLSSVLPNMGQQAAPASPVNMPQQAAPASPVNMGQEAPPVNMGQEVAADTQDPMGEKAVLERLLRMQILERRSEWLMKNENISVPWNEHLTWGDYLDNIRKKQGTEAQEAIVDEQLKIEAETPPKETPVLPSVPLPNFIDTMAPAGQQMAPAGQQMASTGQQMAPAGQQMVPAGPQGIMAAVQEGLPRFATGGVNPGPVLPGMELPIALRSFKPGEDNEGDDRIDRTLGGITALTPGAVGLPSWEDFIQTPAVNVGAYYQGEPTSGAPLMGTTQEIADAYRDSIESQSKPVFSGISGRPISETLENWVSNPTAVPGAMLSILGVPFAGTILDSISDYTRGIIAEGYAKEQLGVPGHRTGIYDGLPFLVGPARWGPGKVLTTAAQGLTLEQAEAALDRKANREQQWSMGDALGTAADYYGAGPVGPDPDDEGMGNGEAAAAGGDEGMDMDEEGWNTGGLVTADRLRGLREEPTGGLAGFALGGMNPAPGGPPVGEEEFMATLSQLSNEAGIPEEQLSAVAEEATRATGGSMAANDNVMDSGIMQTVEAVEATDGDMSGIGSLTEISSALAESGEEGLIHATPGEIVFDPSRLPDNERNMLFAALDAAGIDPAAITVGDPANILNEVTGLPAFGIFSKIWKKIKGGVKKVGKFLKRNAGTILGIAGAMTMNPWLAALGSGIGSLIEGKPIQSALISAGLSFAATEWVAPWISEKVGGIQALGLGPDVTGKVPTIGGALNLDASAGSLLGEGLTARTAQRVGTEAIAKSVLADTTAKIGSQALLKNAVTAGTKAGLDKVVAGQIANRIIPEVAGGAIKTMAGAYSPFARQFVPAAGRFLERAASETLATPIATAIGSGVAGLGARAAQPMVEAMITGVPATDEQAVLDAWNQRYDYTPSSSELYQFYTSDYLPNQQVNVASTLGSIPGYSPPILAAGGGYIDGAGGPKSDSNLARLSNGEFVMTEAAVRGAGYGDRILGAKRMYNIMNGLERRAA